MQYFLHNKIFLRKISRSVALLLIMLIIVQTTTHAASDFNSFSRLKPSNTANKPAPIKGKVIDKTTGETVIGASVKIKGSTIGTVTDINGNFTLNADPNAVLVINYIGYEQTEFPLNGQT